MRRELENALDLAKTLGPADLPAFLGGLETVRIVALTRITTPAVETKPDESLTVAQAAKRLGLSASYLYHNWKKYKFARQDHGCRKVLFSAHGLDAYLRKSR